jgi:hypothetical protein
LAMMEPALFSAANLFDAHSSDESGGSESENGFVQRDHAFPGGMVTPLKFIANGLLGFK